MHFGTWYPIDSAETSAPDAAGVLQARAEGILDYESGRSAMVLYACSGADETLRRYVAGAGARDLRRAMAAGARWIRFAAAAEPRAEMDRLLKGFVERFGAPPICNHGGSRRAKSDLEDT